MNKSSTSQISLFSLIQRRLRLLWTTSSLSDFEDLPRLAIFIMLPLSILWKGGKTLDATWLLLGVGVICALFLLIKKFRRPEGERHQTYAIWPACAVFFLWTVLSYYFSTTANYGFDEVLQTGGLLFIFIWLIERKMRKSDATRSVKHARYFLGSTFEERFIILLSDITILACIIGMTVFIFQPVERFVGSFLDYRFHTDYWPNAFAQFLLLSWPLVFIRFTKGWVKEKKAILEYISQDFFLRFGPIGFVLGCFLLTFSRAALIAFVGQVVLLVLLILLRHGSVKSIFQPLKHIAISLLFGMVIFVGASAVRSAVHPVLSVREKVTFSSAEGRSSVTERFQFFGQAFALAKQKPTFGWGPYSFRFVQPRMQNNVLATSDHPHNVFLKLAQERGFIAAIIFGWILFIVSMTGIRLSRTGKRLDERADHLRLGYPMMTIAIAGVIAHNLVDYNLQFVGIALPFWILMGILLRHASVLNKQYVHPRWCTQKRIVIYTALTGVILFAVAYQEGIYLITSSLGRHAEAQGDSYAAIQWYDESENELFQRDMLLSKAHMNLELENYESAKQSVLQYIQRNPEDYRAWSLYGSILMDEDKTAEAAEAFRNARTLGSRYNDLSVSVGLLESLLAETYKQPTSEAAADSQNLAMHPVLTEELPFISEEVLAFADAIKQNIHFVALSPNAEECVRLLIMLSVLDPNRADEYQKLSGEVEEHALMERRRLKARDPGWIW